MAPRTILITGASDGIGAAAARQLAGRGHRLLVTGRSREKTEAVARAAGAEPFVADFARFADVRALAAQVLEALDGEGLDVLANNAGGVFGDREPTVDGHEKTLQVGHLSPFLLTTLLLPSLRAAGGAVIATSSIAHQLFGHIDAGVLDPDRRVRPTRAYGDAKLANVLITASLHHRFHDEGLSAVAFHPGIVRTNFAAGSSSVLRLLYRTPLRRLGLISPEEGGAHLTWFIEGTPDRTWRSGAYYDQRRLTRRVNPQTGDLALAEALWERSAQLVGRA